MIPIKQFEGIYSIDDRYGVYSHRRKKFLHYSLNSAGYPQVILSIKGVRKPAQIHRIVASHYSIPGSGAEVNHKDGNKLNFEHSNLEYVSRLENIRHRISVLGISNAGVKNSRSKLTPDKVLQIRRMLTHPGATFSRIAKCFGVTTGAISGISTGRSWKNVINHS